jgi:DNA-binding NarL/FixJ family response regulator
MKVLIVDDSMALQIRLRESLINVDKEMMISQACTCMKGKEQFLSFEPEIVILDIQLTDGSGINLLREFKEYSPCVKVIIFTNYSTSEFKNICMDLGAWDFIDKSDLLSLLKVINSLKYNHNQLPVR